MGREPTPREVNNSDSAFSAAHLLAAFGILFRGAQGCGSRPGNGETMAEQPKTTTHSRAEGKTTDATAGKKGAGAKPARRRKQTGPAKSRRPARNKHPDRGDAADPLLRLKGGAQKILDEDFDKLLAALENRALRGFTNSLQLLLQLAKPDQPNPSPQPDQSPLTPWIHELMDEPQITDPAEDHDADRLETGVSPKDSGTHQPQPGALETEFAVAES